VTGKITFEIPGLRREAIQPVGIGMTKDGKTASSRSPGQTASPS